MRKLTEKEKKAIASKYEPRFKPAFDAIAEVLADVIEAKDVIGLTFFVESLSGMLDYTYSQFEAELSGSRTLH